MKDEKLYTVLVAPHVSEKSSRAADKFRQFVFEVRRDATKLIVKQAVEKMFSVEVDRVTLCNVRGKVKRHGNSIGRRQDWKKAYVTLKAGHDIDFVGDRAAG